MSFVYTHSSFKSYAAYWRRYIDDVFLIWTGDVDTLLSFHTYLNSSLPGLTFSLSYDYTSMNFLDTTVIINASRNIETDLFVKSTDRNSLLKYDSCHPHHIKRALPKSQHDRVDRIVSNPDTSRLRHSEMSAKFRSRGYPDHVLKFKQNTLGSDVSLRAPRLAFVSTFHPFNSLINKCILQHWDILKNAYPQVKEFNVKPIICNKRCSNIRDCLVRADVGPSISGPIQRVLSTPRNGTFPCLGCHQCSNITKGDYFTHPRSGKRFSIRGHFTCNSSFVVYLIKCPCGLGYVGETTQHVRDRISKHKSTIRCGRSLLPIPDHFLQHNHTVAQLRYQVIDHVPLARRGGDRIKQLKERESFWIYTLQTLSPLGLNRDIRAVYRTRAVTSSARVHYLGTFRLFSPLTRSSPSALTHGILYTLTRKYLYRIRTRPCRANNFHWPRKNFLIKNIIIPIILLVLLLLFARYLVLYTALARQWLTVIKAFLFLSCRRLILYVRQTLHQQTH
ncbi:unnamed protein product [Ranitomeya imitator]|uniref:GIY-YIG domain-containing protein n=1 Tax=Ranitomeya imitator TaxID=111125 RepID=A0ABN9LWC3_9NEOB|nr:unnamed protein product [Ranitomeya imitator]